MANFYNGLHATLKNEGDHYNGSNDYETFKGITKLTAIRHGYFGRLKNMPIEKIESIYKKSYWDAFKLDDLHSQRLANKLFDAHVNCGGVIKKYFQRSINVFNRENVIEVDGRIGELTIDAANKLSQLRLHNTIKAVNSLQAVRYIELAEKNKRLRLFINGWFRLRVACG